MRVSRNGASWFIGVCAAVFLYGAAMGVEEPTRTVEEYSSYGDLYASVSNDEYMRLYHRDATTYREQGDMLAAADRACSGYLEEDFSCSEDEPEGNAYHEWEKYSSNGTRAYAGSNEPGEAQRRR